MDNLTHALTGLTMSRAGLDRVIPKAALLLILAANIPDVDIVALSSGQLHYLEVHRGYSHTLIGLPLIAIIPVLLWAGIFRTQVSSWKVWFRAWLVSCLGVASHLLLDWTNSYGVRPFLPFSSTWYYLDLNYLWDGVILAILLLAALWPILAGLVNGEIGASRQGGRAVAVAALAMFIAYDGSKFLLHDQALAQLQAREYDGQVAQRVAALPGPWNPLLWTGIVETADSFKTIEIQSFGQLNVNAAETFYRMAMDPATMAAAQTEPFRYFQYFARFPVWSNDNTYLLGRRSKLIRLFDLRFSRSPGSGFRASALSDPSGKVSRAWFTFGD